MNNEIDNEPKKESSESGNTTPQELRFDSSPQSAQSISDASKAINAPALSAANNSLREMGLDKFSIGNENESPLPSDSKNLQADNRAQSSDAAEGKANGGRSGQEQFDGDLKSLRRMDEANRQGAGNLKSKIGELSIDMGDKPSALKPESKNRDAEVRNTPTKPKAEPVSDGEDFDLLLKPQAAASKEADVAGANKPSIPDKPATADKLADSKTSVENTTPEKSKDSEKTKKDPAVLDFFEEDPKKFAAVLNENKKETDIGAFATKDKPVVFVGEDHTDKASQAMIADQAAKMKAAGITHFGVEMESATFQPLLDNIFAGKKDALADFKTKLSKGTEDNYPGLSESYAKIIDSMTKVGIKPIALDVGHARPVSYEGYTDRNKHATDIIGGIMKDNPNARIVALGGSNHSGSLGMGEPLDKQLKEHHGVGSTVIHTAGGDQAPRYSKSTFDEANKLDNKLHPEDTVARFAKHLSINESFTIRADRTTGGADAFVFVPKKR